VQPFLQCTSNKYYIFRVCVCSLRYPACNAHAPHYIVICGLSGSTIFLHIISQTVRFFGGRGVGWGGVGGHKLSNIKCDSIFSTNFV